MKLLEGSKLVKQWFISYLDIKVASSHHFEMNLNEMIVSEEEQISCRNYVANNHSHIVGDTICAGDLALL